MEPAFQRGDILFLNNQDDPIRVGEIVVFKIKDRDIPIVHRVMKVHEKELGKVEVLTKGDNNRVDDRGLYAPGQLWLQREDILGIKIISIIIIIIIIIITIKFRESTWYFKISRYYLKSYYFYYITIILLLLLLLLLGMVTIILNDYPPVKYVLIGVMGLFVLTNKES